MRNLKNYFKNRELNTKKLLSYGFNKEGNFFKYEKSIVNDKFKVCFSISEDKQVSLVLDINTLDEYILVDIDDAVGSFVGKVKEEYDALIKDIIDNCTINKIFNEKQTLEILEYIYNTYHDSIEYLWDKFPNNGVIRNKDNKKWYAAILTPKLNNFGIDSDEIIEVIDLRYQKHLIDKIIDYDKIFPAYHMNKQSWISVMLNGSLDNEIIYSLIDNSYDLSNKK